MKKKIKTILKVYYLLNNIGVKINDNSEVFLNKNSRPNYSKESQTSYKLKLKEYI
jgi:hypothetical protein